MCTTITIQSKEKDVFWGRTMDFTFDPFTVNSKITIIPKNFTIQAESLSWQTNYRFMGINMDDSYFFYDGINEAGLVGDAQYLEECSWDSAENLKARGLTPIYGEEIVAWVLSNYGTVAEIAADITRFGLLEGAYQPWVNCKTGVPSPVPCHYAFTDETGASIVLEPTEKGSFKVFSQAIGVMTNSPTYDWHLTNLRNYIELSDTNRGSKNITDELVIQQIESGSGLLGLPGDYTAPSRFIRATFLSKFMDAFSSEQGINQLYKVFNAVIIPPGIEKVKPSATASDFTGYWIGYDVANRSLFIQPHDTVTFTSATLANSAVNDQIQSFEVGHTLLKNQVN